MNTTFVDRVLAKMSDDTIDKIDARLERTDQTLDTTTAAVVAGAVGVTLTTWRISRHPQRYIHTLRRGRKLSVALTAASLAAAAAGRNTDSDASWAQIGKAIDPATLVVSAAIGGAVGVVTEKAIGDRDRVPVGEAVALAVVGAAAGVVRHVEKARAARRAAA